MKIRIFTRLVLLLTLSFFAVSCSVQNDIGNKGQQLPENDLIVQASNPIILNIQTEFRGLSWINGEVLSFRLYNDGLVEFDDYPLDSNTGTLKAEDVKVRKQIKISEVETKEFKDLVASSEFANLNKKYTKIVSSCDAIPVVTVKSKTKTIEIVWCDSLTNPHYSPEFPKLLPILFTKIHKTKSRALGKEVFPF